MDRHTKRPPLILILIAKLKGFEINANVQFLSVEYYLITDIMDYYPRYAAGTGVSQTGIIMTTYLYRPKELRRLAGCC